jgi:lipoprotein-anchoring transpeptidase ErfK/SrfK
MMRWLRRLPVLFTLGVLALAASGPGVFAAPTSASAAAVVARVDLSRQTMAVYVNGARRHNWTVSTGREGWRTPIGNYRPFALTREYYSKKWRMNLPYLVSISESGIAIHGTDRTSALGRPASHGCIRLHTANAAKFYRLVERHGMGNVLVVVSR